MRNILITIYILIVLGLSATAKAEIRILPVISKDKIAAKQFTGEIAQTVDQEGQAYFYLYVSDEEIYELESEIDLTSLNGAEVTLLAVELKHKSGPVTPIAYLGPLQETQSEKLAPVLVVLKIQEIK